jgi:hypothetical protein
MNLFSAKSIGLYSLAIGSAIVFFNVVTSYGEANLKAPLSVAGDYLITAQNLPTCLQQQPLVLQVQQSGIYLNASLTNARQTNSAATNSRPTLSGRLRDRKLDLSGLVPADICPQSSQLQITGSIDQIASQASTQPARANLNRQLKGEMRVSDRDRQPSRSVTFIGSLQPATRSTTAH